MTASSSTSQYALGGTDAEHERLIRQAEYLDPLADRRGFGFVPPPGAT